MGDLFWTLLHISRLQAKGVHGVMLEHGGMRDNAVISVPSAQGAETGVSKTKTQESRELEKQTTAQQRRPRRKG